MIQRDSMYMLQIVQTIRDHTSPDQWKYVETQNNPADHASRGMTADELCNSKIWWSGPEFLWQHDINCPPQYKIINENDPEVKKLVCHSVSAQQPLDILERLEYFSDWFKAKRAVAVCLKLLNNFKRKKNGSSKGSVDNYVPVNVAEVEEAEKEIIKQLQAKAFQNEMNVLKSTADCNSLVKGDNGKRERVIDKASLLYKLDPFIDEDGVMRVGGRLKLANLEFASRHPVILPKASHITNLIICHHHKRTNHQGRGITLNEIRSCGYWIIGGSSLVSRHISKCVTCRKVRSVTQGQKMADLPTDRLEPSPPFTYSAVDFFGPFYVKEGRKELKRYGVLFTCMACRAVHIETANSMDTSSFLSAYRRFVGRRGPVRQLRCDQGTNFVGAKSEYEKCKKEMCNDKVRQELMKDQCDWIVFNMNAPTASHMGGVWERQIRTVRNVLSVLLDQHSTQLDDQDLRTFLIEAENIVNGRPLAVDHLNSPDAPTPLTPNNLLTMKTNVVLPPPSIFVKNDLYCIKRWRRAQYLANQFWSRWRKEYVQSLQLRNKWIRPKRNLRTDDVVIVKDQNVARNQWKLGRVTEAHPDHDGLVRKVKVLVSDCNIDSQGKRTKANRTIIERPIHSLVLLLESDVK